MVFGWVSREMHCGANSHLQSLGILLANKLKPLHNVANIRYKKRSKTLEELERLGL